MCVHSPVPGRTSRLCNSLWPILPWGHVTVLSKGGGKVAEYALREPSTPLGAADCDLARSLPEELRTELPTIEQLER